MSEDAIAQNEAPEVEEWEVEKEYSTAQNIAKLRRLADCMEQGKPFEIMINGERVYVPVRARFTIEYEVGDDEEELEFQFKWDT